MARYCVLSKDQYETYAEDLKKCGWEFKKVGDIYKGFNREDG